MTHLPQIQPSPSRTPRRVVVAVVPNAQFFGVAGPIEAFQIANDLRVHRGKPPAYDVTVAANETSVLTSAGLSICATPLDAVEGGLDTLIVSGRLDMAETPEQTGVLDAIGRHVAAARRVVSVCAGAFVLGDLGLLDGKRCTSHWLVLDSLRRRFPAAVVEADALYVDESPILTSAGCTAGIDLALHLIAQDLGPKTALTVARLMVVFLHRPGGQSQFSAGLSVRAHSDDRLSALISEIVSVPGGDHSVDALASRAGMSTRNFARTFRRATGKPPAAYVRDVRLDAARAALESTDVPPQQVAEACGLGSEETMRRLFHKQLGTSPVAYRRRFRRV